MFNIVTLTTILCALLMLAGFALQAKAFMINYRIAEKSLDGEFRLWPPRNKNTSPEARKARRLNRLSTLYLVLVMVVFLAGAVLNSLECCLLLLS